MKIALPTNGENLESSIAPHFGRAKNYLVYDTENKNFEIFPNSEVSGGKELPPELLNRMGVKAVVCFGLGKRAFDKFKEFGIETYKALEKSIVENIKDFQDGNLEKLKKEDIF